MKMLDETLDKWGVIVAGLCGAHCVALVALAFLLPTAHWLGHHHPFLSWIEPCMAILATLLAVLALVSGLRHHGHPLPVAVGATGLALLWSATLGAWNTYLAEAVATATAGALLVWAHKWNIKCRCAGAKRSAIG